MNNTAPTLIVVTGPTASGKTTMAIKLAKALKCAVISADSRQIYRDIPIGTAAPTVEEMQGVPHYFVGTLALDEYYSAARFEEEVIALLPHIWSQEGYAIMCGGSMMYIDAVCNGIDRLPDVDPQLRDKAWALYHEGGLSAIQEECRRVDPDYYARADINNYKRLVHAVELSWQSGQPYSSMLTGQKQTRPFRIVKIAPEWSRELLFERINARVDRMISDGFEEEARKVYPLRHLNSLNTVGYKEMFAMIDGTMERTTAIARMAKNTRVYAKKQLTWMQRDPSIIRGAPTATPSDILSLL